MTDQASISAPPHEDKVRHQRLELLRHFTRATDKLMIALALVWIGLMIRQLTGDLSRPLTILNTAIWIIFILDYLIKLMIAPHKTYYIRHNWLTGISLILPAFRAMRIFQALRSLQALSLLRILTSTNRAMAAVSQAMGRQGAGTIIAITLIVMFAGAAGMYQFEKPSTLVTEGFGKVADQGGGLQSYTDAIWWTFMLMTTIGSQYWPVTSGGRLLCFFLSLYSLGVFGYITALIATIFIGREQTQNPGSAPLTAADIEPLRVEIMALRQELQEFKDKPSR